MTSQRFRIVEYLVLAVLVLEELEVENEVCARRDRGRETMWACGSAQYISTGLEKATFVWCRTYHTRMQVGGLVCPIRPRPCCCSIMIVSRSGRRGLLKANPCSPWSQPRMTCPAPSLNSNGAPRSRDESNVEPSGSVPVYNHPVSLVTTTGDHPRFSGGLSGGFLTQIRVKRSRMNQGWAQDGCRMPGSPICAQDAPRTQV
jgi:hypothetical protein